jgi:predicted small metal-binding protein
MATRNLTVRCVCGWELVGPEEDLVIATQEHGRRVHNMEATREEVLAMVVPADEAVQPPRLTLPRRRSRR